MPKNRDEPVGVWNFDTILAHLSSKLDAMRELMDERDSRYNERNTSSEKAIAAALTAVKENTKSSFDASEKAIVKAEESQRDYNVRSNEFRGQLDDQAKTLMPRVESLTMHRAASEKLDVYKNESDSRIDRLQHEVQALRESQSNREGIKSVENPQIIELRAEVQRLTAANNTRTGFDAGKLAAVGAGVGGAGVIGALLMKFFGGH